MGQTDILQEPRCLNDIAVADDEFSVLRWRRDPVGLLLPVGATHQALSSGHKYFRGRPNAVYPTKAAILHPRSVKYPVV